MVGDRRVENVGKGKFEVRGMNDNGFMREKEIRMGNTVFEKRERERER